MISALSPSGAPPRWVIAPPRMSLVVGMGEMLVSNDASAQLVTYSLGSCVGITIYDSAVKVGGMLHAMLPDSTINADRAASRPNMFVDSGLPAMFHAVYALGGLKHRIVVKMAGGAEFLDKNKVFNIGRRNIDALLIMLGRNGMKLEASATGGHESRTMRLDLATGAVRLDTPGRESLTL
jgi:chemotaxis protein CheD